MIIKYSYLPRGAEFNLLNIREDIFTYYTMFPDNYAKIIKETKKECERLGRVFLKAKPIKGY